MIALISMGQIPDETEEDNCIAIDLCVKTNSYVLPRHSRINSSTSEYIELPVTCGVPSTLYMYYVI